MTTNAVTPAPQGGAIVASLATDGGVMTLQQMKANRALMREVMADLMEQGVHYGKVPGSDKPGLFKSGAELLCVIFRVNAKPVVEDLSTPDCIRYRVTMTGVHIPTGLEVATGVGECSSDEEKYKWRRAASKEEWEETSPDRRRWNFKTEVNQVRTNPADAANTVLKMAEKRAKVDLALAFAAASDVFAQDLEDTAEWLRDAGQPEGPRDARLDGKASSKKAPQAKAAGPSQSGPVNAGQLQVLKESIDRAGVPESEVLKKFEIPSLDALPFARLNEALTYCKRVQDGGAS